MVFGGKTSIFQTNKKKAESSSLRAVTTFRLHKSIIATAQHWSMANDDVYTRNVYKTANTSALHCHYIALKSWFIIHTHTHKRQSLWVQIQADCALKRCICVLRGYGLFHRIIVNVRHSIHIYSNWSTPAAFRIVPVAFDSLPYEMIADFCCSGRYLIHSDCMLLTPIRNRCKWCRILFKFWPISYKQHIYIATQSPNPDKRTVFDCVILLCFFLCLRINSKGR